MWDLIVSVPAHCLFFYFAILNSRFSQKQLCYIHYPACVRKIISKDMAVYSNTLFFNETFKKVHNMSMDTGLDKGCPDEETE